MAMEAPARQKAGAVFVPFRPNELYADDHPQWTLVVRN
jgi:hypothetical protein